MHPCLTMIGFLEKMRAGRNSQDAIDKEAEIVVRQVNVAQLEEKTAMHMLNHHYDISTGTAVCINLANF